MAVCHEELMHLHEQALVCDQLADRLRSVMSSQLGNSSGAALYAFLLTALDEFGTEDEPTVERFREEAAKVYRKKFPAAEDRKEKASRPELMASAPAGCARPGSFSLQRLTVRAGVQRLVSYQNRLQNACKRRRSPFLAD